LISFSYETKMDAEALQTFLTIHRQGGFSNAALVLNRTQPAISRRIKLLEDELGAPLFERVATGPVLSQAGRVLLPHAERVLAAVKDAQDAVRALTKETAGPVALAAVGTLAGPPLTKILKRFTAQHQGVALSLRTATSREVSDLVRQGEATIGLRYAHDPSPDLASEVLTIEPLMVVCAADHPLAGRSVKRLAQLRTERWLAFPEAPGRLETAAPYIVASFRAHGLGEPDWAPIDSLTAQKRLVEAGMGLALMAESGASEELASGALRCIDVKDLRAGQEIAAVTRKGGFLSAAGRHLIDLLRSGYQYK
jgi:DNA-binding transcriptional LysR family regulator